MLTTQYSARESRSRWVMSSAIMRINLRPLAVAAAVARFAQLSRRYASHSTRPIGHVRRLLIQISTSLSRRQITLRSRASPLQPMLMTCPLQRLPRVA